jgi:hypothetical protein
MNREQIPPIKDEYPFIVYKTAKKGQSSYRLTAIMLESLWNTATKIDKKPSLIITIPYNKEEFIITCQITKKGSKA